MPPSVSPPPLAERQRPPRRRYHFGSSGWVYVFVTMLIALGAFNSQNNLLFWAFGFSLAILIVSGLLSGMMLMGLEVRRERIEDATAGQSLTIRYRVRNRNRFIPAFALTIEEIPAPASSAGPGGRRGQPSPTTRRIDQPVAFVVHAGPRETVQATTTVATRRRGPLAFSGFVVHTAFPFGLMRKSLIYDAPATAVVRPAPATVDAGALLEQAVVGSSEHPGRLRGPGDEFHSLRDYIPGDNPRSIAWKASARRGTLLVRQSLAPAPRRLWVVLRLRLDTPSGGDPDRLDERAISMAAAVIERGLAEGMAVGLAAPVVRLQAPPRAHPGQAGLLLRELGLIELGPADARGLREPFPHLASSRGMGGLCICIHAGAIDHSFGPERNAIHLSALDATTPEPVNPTTAAGQTESTVASATPPQPALA